jgi:nucleotide-binding universal stress UspA family protein
VRAADEQGVSLIVVASLGRRSGSMWRLGSVADRLSQSSPVPVLVVRDTRPIGRWEREAHPLRVVLALGSGRTSEAAARAVAALRRHGPIELVEVHAYDPLEMAQRLGLREAESTEARRMIENSLARDLAGRVGQWAGPGEARFVALPARGHVAEALAEFADAERADLVVLGAQGRGALQRRLLGSISYGVLPLVGTNVLVVPTPATAKESAARAPSVATRVKSVLVATDLTEFGNRALEHALGALPEGGRLVLFHARRPPVGVPDHWRVPYMQEEARMNRALAEAELKKLAAQIEGKLETVVEAVESEDPAQAILEAAERHGVDLLCLGTHGRGRLATALLGSVAREVARRSPRPVLLVPHRPG